jgi:nicotinate-nucleotide pyrophosphorylase (carboxylating)
MTTGAAARDLVARALAEDVGGGDVTSAAVVPGEALALARIVQKQAGVVFGLDVAAEVFAQAGAGDLEPVAAEGEWRDEVPVEVARIEGRARELLAAERTALNFLCHLSGVATLTARYVAAARGAAKILDTRKTTPAMRALEKAAVAAGGGRNHRMGLHDAILIKENHVALAGRLVDAVRVARAEHRRGPIEVECRDLDEVAGALAAGADRILLDNMAPAQLREAVAARDRERPDVELEASGGVTLETVGEVAATGVDYVSVGALTHSAPALDLSLLVEPL